MHLSLSNLHSTSRCGNLYVMTEADSEPIGQHSEHPLEMFLLSV